jgi:hypothetical protein
MSGPALKPRVASLGDGRYRAEVVIADAWGGSNVFRGGVVATHALALEAAQRLISAASVELPVEVEFPPSWK